jgi:hypothetical protein
VTDDGTHISLNFASLDCWAAAMVYIYQSFIYSSNYTVHQLKGPEFATLEMPPYHKLFNSATTEQLGKKSLLLEYGSKLDVR